MSHNLSPTFLSKVLNKKLRKKEEDKIDQNLKINSSKGENAKNNKEIQNKKCKYRNSNSYIESFLSRRKLAADHAQSKRVLSNNKKISNIGNEKIESEKVITIQKEIKKEKKTNLSNDKNYKKIYANNSQNKGFQNYKNKFVNFREKKDQLKKESKNNDEKRENYYYNFLTDNSEINNIRSIKQRSKNYSENKESSLTNDEFDINNKYKNQVIHSIKITSVSSIHERDNNSNFFNNNKNSNENNKKNCNILENNYGELNEPEELMKPQLPEDIKEDLLKYQKYFTSNSSNKNKNMIINNNKKYLNNFINQIQIQSQNKKLNNIISSLNNNNTEENKNMNNTSDISSIKFQQLSAFNEANSQEKIKNSKKRIIINRMSNSCRNNLDKNKYIIIHKNKDNNNIVPLSAKNKNFKFNSDVINFIQNNKKIIKEKNNNKENLYNNINNRELKISNEKNITIEKKNLAEKNNENNNNINKDTNKGVEKNRNEKMDKKLNEINIEKNENKQNKIESENENKKKDNDKKNEKNEKIIILKEISGEKFEIKSKKSQRKDNINNGKSINKNNFIICQSNNFEQLKEIKESNNNNNKIELICSKENEIALSTNNKKNDKNTINNKNKSNDTNFQISKNINNFSIDKLEFEDNKKIKLEISNNEEFKIINKTNKNNGYNNVKSLRENYYYDEDNNNNKSITCSKQTNFEINKIGNINNDKYNNNILEKKIMKNLFNEDLIQPHNLINIINKDDENKLETNKNGNNIITSNNDEENKYDFINGSSQNIINKINLIKENNNFGINNEQINKNNDNDNDNEVTERKNKIKMEINNLIFENSNNLNAKTSENNLKSHNSFKKVEQNKVQINEINESININNNNNIKNIINKSTNLQNLMNDIQILKKQNINTNISKINDSNLKNEEEKEKEKNQIISIKNKKDENINLLNRTLTIQKISSNLYNLKENNNFLNKDNKMENYYNNMKQTPDINLIVEKKPFGMILFDEKEYKRIKDKNFGQITNKKINYDYTNKNRLWNTSYNINRENYDKRTYLNRVKEDVLNGNNLNLYNNYINNYQENSLVNNTYTLRYRNNISSGYYGKINDIMPVNNMINMKAKKNNIFNKI